MKKIIALLLALALVPFCVSAFAEEAVPFTLFLVDDFERADLDIAGQTNSDGRTTWWYNPETNYIEDGALVMPEGSVHFGVGADAIGEYLVLTVKGSATGILLAPGGNAVPFASLVDSDGNPLPELTDEWQQWVVDVQASGLTSDMGFHINKDAAGVLYIDDINYASYEIEEIAAADETASEFPDPALVDDFDRPADELDNSGGFNSQGADTWWYNAEINYIEDNALVMPSDSQHFGVGANVPAEANYAYLVLVMKGDATGILLNLGAKNPVEYEKWIDPYGAAVATLTDEFQSIVIDIEASGIVFDQGFHINKAVGGVLAIDEIYYTNIVE
ncbi:MAG: hypothetical protein LBD16_07670 [Oscillospiraceae bacterium]|jgi:hypothetical protein|nr:hypothetical protein [Oscillospiraceae bacterium]